MSEQNDNRFVIYLLEHTDGETSHKRLLRCASVYTGLPAETFRREQEDGQKPVLTGGPDLHFSVSHSGNWWVCAFGPRPVGLDLQQHRPCRREAIARRFFHPDEAAWLEAQNFAEEAFFRLWAAKESYVKLTGGGLGQGFETFSAVEPLPPSPQWKHIPFLPDYSLCLCTQQAAEVTLIPLSPINQHHDQPEVTI